MLKVLYIIVILVVSIPIIVNFLWRNFSKSSHAQATRLYNRGVDWRNRKKYEEAICCFKESLRLWPTKFRKEISDTYCNLCDAYCMLKRYDEARALAKEAVDFNPSDPRLQHGLGITYRNLENIEEAKKYFHKAIDMYIKNNDQKSAEFCKGLIRNL